MNPDPLAQLRDIHLPDGSPWWPLAPGWWSLLLLVLLALAVLAWRHHQRKLARRYRDVALRELERLLADYRVHGSFQDFAPAVSELLKRVALQAYPALAAGSLSGEAWIAFLAARLPSAAGIQAPPAALGEALYQRRIHGNAAELYAFAAAWIEHHPEHPRDA